MSNQTDVKGSDSSTETDDRGVPIKNLQAEMARKLQEMEERTAQRMEAIVQKLDSLTTREEEIPAEKTDAAGYDEREELRKISARPRGYVEDIVRPIKEENEALKKDLEKTRVLAFKNNLDRVGESIAQMEGKKQWSDLPNEFQNKIVGIIKEKGWGNNPNSAFDAYELLKAREIREKAKEPERIERIEVSQTEGAGRISGKTPVKTVTREMLSQLASTLPGSPDYKKNMGILSQVQTGAIRVEQ